MVATLQTLTTGSWTPLAAMIANFS